MANTSIRLQKNKFIYDTINRYGLSNCICTSWGDVRGRNVKRRILSIEENETFNTDYSCTLGLDNDQRINSWEVYYIGQNITRKSKFDIYQTINNNISKTTIPWTTPDNKVLQKCYITIKFTTIETVYDALLVLSSISLLSDYMKNTPNAIDFYNDSIQPGLFNVYRWMNLNGDSNIEFNYDPTNRSIWFQYRMMSFYISNYKQSYLYNGLKTSKLFSDSLAPKPETNSIYWFKILDRFPKLI